MCARSFVASTFVPPPENTRFILPNELDCIHKGLIKEVVKCPPFNLIFCNLVYPTLHGVYIVNSCLY